MLQADLLTDSNKDKAPSCLGMDYQPRRLKNSMKFPVDLKSYTCSVDDHIIHFGLEPDVLNGA